MDPMENIETDEDNSEGQQSQTEGAELNLRPTLSQVKKSWGFRRTTIARRQFREEVGNLQHTTPRRGRSQRTTEAKQSTPEMQDALSETGTSKSYLGDLEWSAPSSPASEESKEASEASGSGLDPSLWQDYGSAFHTAFSLLCGNESVNTSDVPTPPDLLAAPDLADLPPAQTADETEEPDAVEAVDDVKHVPPLSSGNVAGEVDDVVLISSQDDDSDDMTLIQLKEKIASESLQENLSKDQGGKGVRGRPKGRGRGRGRGRAKGRGRGRGRGRPPKFQTSIADEVDGDDEVMFVNSSQGSEVMSEKEGHQQDLTEVEVSSAHSDTTLSPAEDSNTDCIIIDTGSDPLTDDGSGQFDDAVQKDEDVVNVGTRVDTVNTEGYDATTLCCVCRQNHSYGFLLCCDTCQKWSHGSCVAVSETQRREMKERGRKYTCHACSTKNQLEPERGSTEAVTLCHSDEDRDEQQTDKEVDVVEDLQHLKEVKEEKEKEEVKVKEEKEASVTKQPEAKVKMEKSDPHPLCIGPGCPRQALPESVYCGTDCILQHAAFTMKTLSVPTNARSSRSRPQRKPTTPTTDKDQRSLRVSKRLAEKAKESGEEGGDKQKDVGDTQEAATVPVCDPSLSDVQTTSIPSPQFCTVSAKSDTKQPEGATVTAPPTQSLGDNSTNAAPDLHSVAEVATPPRDPREKQDAAVNAALSGKQQPTESQPAAVSTTPEQPGTSSPSPSASASVARLHDTGALVVTKTSYVIPKKQTGLQPPAASSSGPALLTETRNLLVPPAPSAPSSRPSQPNNQIRQSIQRSLVSILSKRVSESEDLEMSESDAAKLVANIEMEMFDVFRTTDSKYMNKYRTIMFNLKDPKNKGLLYRVVHGEIGPFRLVRMSQKDMQATTAPEPSPKETPEVKDPFTKSTGSLQKPEAVKVDLPSLNPRPERPRPSKRPESSACPPQASLETKKSFSAAAVKTRTNQPNFGSSAPDILTCMLKDTTSEHKTHLFDLKCRICTGQVLAEEPVEPVTKKPRFSETEKRETSWRKYDRRGDDSPLLAPPDSPDSDSPTALTIVESPSSPLRDSPASPILESPASPVLESPASPTSDIPKATTQSRPYTPVVIPAVSTVTITRRDPRTAARFFTLDSSSTAPSGTAHNQSGSYTSHKDNSASSVFASKPSPLPPKPLPKSILMKPSSSSDPRLYRAASRSVTSEGEADTAQFLSKQETLWKGFVNMLNVARFVTKGYLVSGSAELIKRDLPETLQVGGRILPHTVWEYVAKLKTSVTKELCVIRFHPATEEEEVAYVSLFSYFSSRGRFGVVSHTSHSIKDVYLVPLSSTESIPPLLQPFEGPGLEKNRPNLLLGLAVVQKVKRSVTAPQDFKEKRPKDPMWIPKPPVLYGSDKLEIFQPCDSGTPSSSNPSGSLPSHSFSSVSGTESSAVAPPQGCSRAAVVASSSTNSDKNLTSASSNKTPQRSLSLFHNKPTDSAVTCEESSTASAKNTPVLSQVDPIVQQFGHKSKGKNIEKDRNDFERPYDPEEEYNPTMGYKTDVTQNTKAVIPSLSDCVEDDVAYDPEDETIFQDIQSNTHETKTTIAPTGSTPGTPPVSTQAATPTTSVNSVPTTSAPAAAVLPNLPSGTVVVSAATLSEQQRMLDELNKQIEEQKRQLKEQEEALRQQREAVGIFMAQLSSNSLYVSPSPSGMVQTESRTPESPENSSNLTETEEKTTDNKQTVEVEDTTADVTDTTEKPLETQENVEAHGKESSAGEIEDSDVAYDPEDESLFNLIQEDVFQGLSSKSHDSTGQNSSHKSATPNSNRSRKRKSSPKRHSHRERDSHRSPSKKSRRRSPSHPHRHRERDRHKRNDKERSRHSSRNRSERQSRHHKAQSTHRHLHGHKRSSSSPTKRYSRSYSPKRHQEVSPEVPERSEHEPVPGNVPDSVGQMVLTNVSVSTSAAIKPEPDGHLQSSSESLEKDISTNLTEVQSVKIEVSEQNFDLKNSDSCFSAQVDNPTRQEIMLIDKLDSAIPLREIDPPLRDSPESPDPEPQFLKVSGTEEVDCKTEEFDDCETHPSLFLQNVKVENSFVPISGQTQPPLCNNDEKDLNSVNEQLKREFSEFFKQNTATDVKELSDFGQQMQPKETSPGIPDTSPRLKGDGLNILSSQVDNMVQEKEGSRTQDGTVLPSKRLTSSCTNSDLEGTSTDRCGLDTNSLQSMDPLLAVDHPRRPEMRVRALDVKGEDKTLIDRSGSPQTDSTSSTVLVVETDQSPRSRAKGQRFRGSGKVQKEGFQPNEQNANSVTQHYGTPSPYDQNMVGLHTESNTNELHTRDQVWSGPETDNWRGTAKKGLRSHTQETDRGSGAFDFMSFERREPNIKETMHVTKESGRPNLKGAETEREGPNMGHYGAGVMGGGSQFNELDIKSPHFESAVPPEKGSGFNRRGPEGPCFRGPTPERRSPFLDGPGHARRQPGGPDFRGPRVDSEYCPLDGIGPDKRNSEGQDFRKPGPDRQRHYSGNPGTFRRQSEEGFREPAGSSLESHGAYKRQLGARGLGEKGPPNVGPDSEEMEPCNPDRAESHCPPMKKPRIDRRDSEGLDFRGPGPEGREPKFRGGHFRKPGPPWGCPSMVAPGSSRRDPDGPDFRGLEPKMRGPGANYRRPIGLDFPEPGSETQMPPMENSETEMTDSEGPDSEWRGPSDEDPCTNRRRLRGPVFNRSGYERRDPTIDGPGADIIDQNHQDLRGSGHKWVGPVNDNPVTYRRGPPGPDFRSFGPERGGPPMHRRLSDDFRRRGAEWRVAVDSPDAERRGPTGPGYRDVGPNKRGHLLEGPEIAEYRGPGHERNDPANNGPNINRRGPPGPNHRGPGAEWFDHAHEDPDNTRREPPGTNFRGFEYERQGPVSEGRAPVMQGPRFGGQIPTSQEFIEGGHEVRGPNREGPRGSDYRGQRPEKCGHAMDDPETNSNDVRVPWSESRDRFMEGPGRQRRGPGNQYLRGAAVCHGPSRRGMRGHNFTESRRSPCIDSQDPDKQDLKGPGFHGHNPENVIPGGLELGAPRLERRSPLTTGEGNMRRRLGYTCGLGRSGPHIRGRARPHFRGRGSGHMLDAENSPSFSEGPQSSDPWPEKQPLDFDGSMFERSAPHTRRVGPQKPMPGYENDPSISDVIGPNIRSLQHGISESADQDFMGPETEIRDVRSHRPDIAVGPDFRDSGPPTEGQRHDRRNDWGIVGFRGQEAVEENFNVGPGRKMLFRGRRPMKRNSQRRGSNTTQLSQEDRWENTEIVEKRSDLNKPSSELNNERLIMKHSRYRWNKYDNTVEVAGLSEQGQKTPFAGLTQDKNRTGPRPLQHGSDVHPEHGPREEPSNEWRESNRGGFKERPRGRGAFFRGTRRPHYEDQAHEPHNRRFWGPDQTEGEEMGSDCRQLSQFKGRGAHRVGPCQDRRACDSEGPHTRDPGDGRQRFDEFRQKMTHGPGRLDKNTGSGRYGPETMSDTQNQPSNPQRQRTALLPTPTGVTPLQNCTIGKPGPKQQQTCLPGNRTWSRDRPSNQKRPFSLEERKEQETSPAGKRQTSFQAISDSEKNKTDHGNGDEQT